MIFGVVKITTATKVSRTVTPRGKKKCCRGRCDRKYSPRGDCVCFKFKTSHFEKRETSHLSFGVVKVDDM